MVAKVGDVIESSSGKHVITLITNGQVSETKRLEDFIAKHAMVKVDGEWLCLQDIIKERCEMYLRSGIDVIRE